MNRKFGLAPLIGLIVAGILLLAGCDKLGEKSSTPEPTSSTQTTEDAPPDEKEIKLVNQDGSDGQLPLFDGNGKVIDNGDSTKQPETPPVASEALLQRCSKKFINWEQLAKCVGGDEWYKKGATTMEPYTGFRWGDIQKWAKAKEDVNGNAVTDMRLIHVYGYTPEQKSAEQAQTDVRALTDNTALRVIYHNEDMPNGFVNSRGLKQNTVSPFADRQPQVRVSLAPLVLNEKGQITDLRTDAGVFVDCLNYWGKAFAIAPAPGKPILCPPGSGMAGQPIPPNGPKGCTPPPTTTNIPPPPPPCEGPGCNPNPPCVGTACNPKNPNQGSNHNGNAAQGGGQKQQSGPGTFEPPPPVVVAPYQAPPPPANTGPPAGSTPTSTGTPPPPNSGAGNENSGTVPPPP